MNTVSTIQALAQTGKWLEEMALKIRGCLDLVKAEENSLLAFLSVLCRVLHEDVAGDSVSFLVMKGFYPKSPET